MRRGLTIGAISAGALALLPPALAPAAKPYAYGTYETKHGPFVYVVPNKHLTRMFVRIQCNADNQPYGTHGAILTRSGRFHFKGMMRNDRRDHTSTASLTGHFVSRRKAVMHVKHSVCFARTTRIYLYLVGPE